MFLKENLGFIYLSPLKFYYQVLEMVPYAHTITYM